MEDQTDPVPSNSSLQKKKSKKKKKKNGSKPEQEPQETPKVDQEKQPQQTTDRDETIIRTTKCSYCGKSVRQLLRGFKNPENVNPGPVVCEICLKTISQQKEEYRGGVAYIETEKSSGGSSYRPTRKSLKETLCNCVACVSKRDNTVTPEVERDAHITQSYWMEIRHIVRCIYRENMSLSAVATRDSIGSDKMRSIVRKLCCRDPHQFFQRLETLAREYLLEVKVRLLEQLSCGFNSPQLAIEFIQMLLDEYSSLCAALPALLYLLEPLEETEYIRRLGVTIELVNKNIFRELIFAESFMSSNLPLIIAQLRLASLSSDPFHRSTADALSQRYNSLDDEMDMIGNVWNTAKDQLKQQQQQQQESKRREERRAHIEKILSDGESFIKKHSKKEQHQHQQQNEEYITTPVQASTDKIQDETHEASDSTPLLHSSNVTNHKLHTNPQPFKTTTTSSSKPSNPSSSSVVLHDQPILTPLEVEDIKDNDGWMTKEQISEWSKILFKCIKPIGDPEFRITDNIATHTITLKIDMTAIDLRHAESMCTHEQVKKYEELGMRREEIAEVALKLNAIKHLGINLRIDDLFDEHGFVIVDGNDYHEEREDAVYFVEEGKHSVKGKEKLLEEELNRSGLVDLQNEKEKVICREENEMGEGRETDLLQSMTMKIRFMKSVPDEDTKTRLMSDSEQVMFESCDQVQMKLTQLELNTMRLMCTNKCLATNLGIRKCKASMDVLDNDEERFVHTNTNQPFVGLLLEQGKQAEQLKKDQEEEEEEKTTSTMEKEEEEEEKERVEEEVDDQQISTVEDEVVTTKVPEQVSSEGSKHEVVAAGVCIPSQSHSCQCFACIGAVAAQITEGSLHPLNPVDPCGSKLTIKDIMSAKLHSSDTPDGDYDKEQQLLEQQQSNKSVSNKAEHLHVWQNWMSSTTHSSPDVSDHGPITPTPEPSCEATTPEQPSTPVTNNSDSGNSSLSLATTCSDGGTTITTSSNGSSGTSNGSTTMCTNEEHHNHLSGTSHKGTGNCPVKRYCPCCYCELFGQNTPTVPTSHNYTKQRDKMRQKLEKKRKQEHVYCHHGHNHHHHDESQQLHSPIDVHQEHQHHHHHHHHHHHASPPAAAHHSQPTPSPPPPSSSPLHPVSRNNNNNSSGGSNHVQQQQQQRKQEKSLDEILKFIEGDDFNESSSNATSTSTSATKNKKKKKGKKKTEAEPTLISNGHITTPSNTGGVSDNGGAATSGKKGGKKEEKGSNGSQQQNGGLPQQKKAATCTSFHNQSSQGSHKSAGSRINSPKMTKQSNKKTNRTLSSHSNGLPKLSSVKSDHQLHSEYSSLSDMDEDYDKEIEEFKKLCLNSAPVESRKKIHVSLNMKDILSKVK